MGVTHGKLGVLYRRLLNGFKPLVYGAGLNDLTWGTYTLATDSVYIKITIDLASTPDTFTWTEDGGGGASDVAITGASQDIVATNGTQAVEFAADTGHTVGDSWSIGNLYDELTTVVVNVATITDATMLLLNPNATFTITKENVVNLLKIDWGRGAFTFDAAPGATTIVATNGFIREADALTKIGHMYDWTMDIMVEEHDLTSFQNKWQIVAGGLARGSGTAEGFHFCDYWRASWAAQIVPTEMYHLLQLFSYDPADDRTGDHWDCWVVFPSISQNVPINEYIKETMSFTVHGAPVFTADV